MRIVVFGASSDIGQRAARLLLDGGHAVCVVARDTRPLDRRAERITGSIDDAPSIVRAGDVVVSCAHARHTQVLLQRLPKDTGHVVLIGSTWRYSKVPNPSADEVREAERQFSASGRPGVMLHPTMTYGGTQENNIQRLIATIRRWPVFPLPGGGSHLVQPIFVDDVARAIASAALADWQRPEIIPIAGPRPLTWKEMVQTCMEVVGQRRPMISVPLWPAIVALEALEATGLRLGVDSSMLLRFRESSDFDVGDMIRRLKVEPREFASGLREALARDGTQIVGGHAFPRAPAAPH